MVNQKNLKLYNELFVVLKDLQQVKLENYKAIQWCKSLDFTFCDQTSKTQEKYDFVSRVSGGCSLFVGEGNLSFSVSLFKKLKTQSEFIASTYEEYSSLSDASKFNSKLLKQYGAKILHNIDATQLYTHFKKKSFYTIVFQFPHSGSREGERGMNSNYKLVRDFLLSASSVLSRDGIILITAVDTDFYNNMFKFEELAKEFSMRSLVKYKFSPKDYSEYEHTMTHQEGSAIDEYSCFTTWEFRP